jgi:hypothetical protein
MRRKNNNKMEFIIFIYDIGGLKDKFFKMMGGELFE